ncbi:hypothetical protein E2C01_079352 [Portunus trituberculatus]|uniref:Uncharacterized protein n=1 Tax=Portunus trituberculatus TaxID=210409 RepID=A0A5B7IVD8_PORTR|nr:hypothetical protein [Portunus trituberculatus]
MRDTIQSLTLPTIFTSRFIATARHLAVAYHSLCPLPACQGKTDISTKTQQGESRGVYIKDTLVDIIEKTKTRDTQKNIIEKHTQDIQRITTHTHTHTHTQRERYKRVYIFTKRPLVTR